MSSKATEPKKTGKAKDGHKTDKKNKRQTDANSEPQPSTSEDPVERLSPAVRFSPTKSGNLRTPSINTLLDSIGSDNSEVTLESLKYLQILDQYVTGKHFDFDVEYILNSISGVVWSLVIIFFMFYDIDDQCWQRLDVLLVLSALVSSVTALELTGTFILWYSSRVFKCINLSKICATVIVYHIVIAFLNLLIAIVEFGSRTCHQWGDLDHSRQHLIPVYYDLKFIGIMHLIVSVNLMFCAMVLAIKRNDFKFYVLWRKGLLNQYLMLEDD